MEQRREALVAELRAKGIALSPALERAFLDVPRHLFVPGVYLDAVYRDNVIITRRDKFGVPVSSSSQPAIMAIMNTALDVQPGQHVLEIGTGTGYNAAILAALVGESGSVTSVEIDAETADAAVTHLQRAGFSGVRVVVGDGANGLFDPASFDRIISTAAAWDLPDEWATQLKDDGLLVTPFIFAGMQIGAALRKQSDGSFTSTQLFPLGFIALQGEAAPPIRHVRIPGSALLVSFADGRSVDEAGVHTLFSDDHELAQWPLDLDVRAVSLFNYYQMFYQPAGYQFVTYHVEEGQMAYGLEAHGWGMISSTSACLIPAGEHRVIHVYGGAEAYLVMVDLAEKWNAAGRPGLDRCHVRVVPAGGKPYLPPAAARDDVAVRVFARPTHNYTLWLEPVAAPQDDDSSLA
ncbi:MAG: methyltransferase domain-containing protein [Anaerolineae bacterium]|nr:methyltransferase domain-containing protein [Anaerolineae bacterium]